MWVVYLCVPVFRWYGVCHLRQQDVGFITSPRCMCGISVCSLHLHSGLQWAAYSVSSQCLETCIIVSELSLVCQHHQIPGRVLTLHRKFLFFRLCDPPHPPKVAPRGIDPSCSDGD